MSGRVLEIEAGGYAATVVSVGAALAELRHGGRDLVVPFDPRGMRPLSRGALLAPWPNRVADGRWTWRGRALQLPLTEPERGHAIHGLVGWAAWEVRSAAADRVVLAHRLHAQEGYPFVLDLEAAYAVDGSGLTTTLVATNAGGDDAPYGCGPHPYLTTGSGRVDDWTLTLPAAARLEVDERLLPTGVRPVEGPGVDFRAGGSLRGVALDHCYTGLAPGGDGVVRVAVRGAAGEGVAMTFGPWARWVQVHTADRPEPGNHRVGLAVEPMSCPPNALVSGEDLVVLPPGGRHEASWRIAAV